eukprot:1192204-Prorocentrum_minimum.AAC.2
MMLLPPPDSLPTPLQCPPAPRGQIYRPRVRCAAAWAGQAAAPAPSGGSSRVPQGGATVTGTGTVTGTATVTVTGTAS